MSMLVAPVVESKTLKLKQVWVTQWSNLAEQKQASDSIVQAIEEVRVETRLTLKNLD